jgi:hypothetical protein
MIITSHDDLNIFVGIDLIQAKMLVGILRRASAESVVAAAKEVVAAGFSSITAADAEVARLSAVAVLSPLLDRCVHSSMLLAPTSEQAQAIAAALKKQRELVN